MNRDQPSTPSSSIPVQRPCRASHSAQRAARDREVEERLWERLVAERVVPPLQLVVAETGVLERALEQQPVLARLPLDAGIERVRQRVEAVEAGAHVDRVVGETL